MSAVALLNKASRSTFWGRGQPGVAQKPNVGLAYFQAVATKMSNPSCGVAYFTSPSWIHFLIPAQSQSETQLIWNEKTSNKSLGTAVVPTCWQFNVRYP